MNSHEFAEQILQLPSGEIMGSIDIDTEIKDKHGDTIVAKLYAHSVCEVFSCNGDVVVQFEQSSSGSDTVDVVEATKDAVRRLDSELPIDGVASECSVIKLSKELNLTVKRTGVKRIGGEFILLREDNDIKMSFMRVADGFQRIY
ncbi:hypothetical protein OTK49_02660 [Vibrio coralliirubri]|uniref:hypothetical protein n=1 Tax=Vibrio coralliirubri TaxID=1516159 RepID=UPI0022850EFB|nr:hypothetical protein [Vibrio coralliirubri]MCY9861419.1 hypothetical protein [Vibrio coralliirubri]